ncbi:MAG: [protein-PII] uridylyltransferase [Desulfosarcinaceae bacterium]|nr:[protein-PII] uridylyltransferase [Desulfosarcinaceae bacterium]
MTAAINRQIRSTASERLATRRESLIQDLLPTAPMEFNEGLARLIDDYFIESFEQSQVGQSMSLSRQPYALIALGGYGRSEQSLFSDVDLLFLFKKRVPKAAESLVGEIVYPLWDLGLEVGHATRSIRETIKLAGSDMEVLTALLDARFICGYSPLYTALMEQVHARIISQRPGKLTAWLIESNRSRHERFGDSAYLLEPNLKEGQGGLRDYHTMAWIARIKSDIRERRDLEFYGYLSHDEYMELEKALAFIWHVRNRLHQLMGRKVDQLHLEHQVKLAAAMGIESREGYQPVELLMGRLHEHMEFVKQRHNLFLYELAQKKRLKRKNKQLKTTTVPGLKFNRGMLNFSTPQAIVKRPRLLLEIFLESAVKKAPLNAEARRLIHDLGHLVTAAYRRDPENVRLFEKILAKPVQRFNVLGEMLNTGFLARFLPEFESVINRIQFDQYHLYPVGRHSLRTVRLLKTLGLREHAETDPLSHQVYREIKHRKLLLWSALLHDIGKGTPESGHAARGAELAGRILSQRGYREAEIDTVVFLVKHHLLLANTATRRDINDEETAIFVAAKVASIERLKMLYLLTVADSMATGPKAWNDWTAALFRSLFLKALKLLEKGELASGRALKEIEAKKQAVIGTEVQAASREEIEALFRVMSPRYLLYAKAEVIPQHIELYRKLGDGPFVWKIEKTGARGTRTVTICAKDRPGLLANIAGVLTLNGIDIRHVQIYTWRNNVALDIFEVNPPPDQLFEFERWKRAETHLHQALAGELDPGAALAAKDATAAAKKPHTTEKPPRVVVDNEGSSFFTILEVFAFDSPGLLYKVTDTLFRCGLDIWVAKIATKVDQVVDVFYVRDFDGEKIDDPEQVAAIKSAVTAVLPDA